MSPPALLIGAALAFWGWQTRLLILGIFMGAALELSRASERRWDFSRADFIKVSDLCTVLFVAGTIYLYATQSAVAAFMTISKCLPMTFFFLMAAQAYSRQGKVDFAALALSWRARGEGGLRGEVDIAYPYFILCVICASAGNIRGPGFYVGMAALSSWALWSAKPRRTPRAAWVVLLAGAVGLGWAGQIGLHGLQGALERKAMNLLFGGVDPTTDPYHSRTAIGQIGALKQSGDIMLRVTMEAGEGPPPLLREASYDSYRESQWVAKSAPFVILRQGEDEGWAIAVFGPRQASVSQKFPGGEGLLALPSGVARVSGLYAGTLSRNRFGTVRVESAAPWATYRADFGERSADAPPGAQDLAVPAEEGALFALLSKEMHLNGLPAARTMKTVADYYEKNFTYSIYQAERKGGVRPLENFILNTKSGHCELFATSAVLLLREAGVPARYATGYSLQEYSRLEKAFVVRQRHAHAWAEAYVGGVWRDFDVTPASWGKIESRRAGWSEPIDDLFSWAQTRFALWRWRKKGGLSTKLLGWLLIPLVAIAAWRFAPRVKTSAPEEQRPAAALSERPGNDSEWYEIEKELEGAGAGRRLWETPGDWLGRVGIESLRPLLSLHHRYRFDPEGLDKRSREGLRTGVRSWLQTHRRRKT